jgi:hypothetical protein
VNWSDNRKQILAELRQTYSSMGPPLVNELEIPELQQVYRRFDLLLDEFAENVPPQALSRCPHCGAVFELPFDHAGLDSPWWWDACPLEYPPPRACEHFVVFLGAVDLHDRVPSEVDLWSVIPGPGVPFVIERLLSMEGMIAVVSSMRVGASDTGYLIAYFSTEPLDQIDLHQEWRRETWTLYDDDGESIAENTVNDPWDFELGPWLESEKLHWIAPDDSELSLKQGRPSPYENLGGVRMMQLIASGELELDEPPSGTEPDYFGHDDWEGDDYDDLDDDDYDFDDDV